MFSPLFIVIQNEKIFICKTMFCHDKMLTMKETKDKKIEIRVSAKEFHKLKLRAQLYSEGNISKLIRYWINDAPLKFLPRTKTPKEPK